MLILIILGVLFVSAVLVAKFGSWDYAKWGFGISLFSGLVLFVALLFLPISRMDIRSQIQQFESVRTTANAARERGDDMEGAAFRLKVAEMNQWLAAKKYWRSTIFEIYIPADVDSLEPIQ